VSNVTDELDGRAILIPRAEIHAIAEKHGHTFNFDRDPKGGEVRAQAAIYRSWFHESDPERARLLAVAAELDALVDRIEAPA
jgi:hypothetical protein